MNPNPERFGPYISSTDEDESEDWSDEDTTSESSTSESSSVSSSEEEESEEGDGEEDSYSDDEETVGRRSVEVSQEEAKKRLRVAKSAIRRAKYAAKKKEKKGR